MPGEKENPKDWRTVCGLAYAGWRFSRHVSTEGFPVDSLCRNCFGEVANSKEEEAVEKDDSSSSSSGSSSGD